MVQIQEKLAKMCVYIHMSVSEMADKFCQELRRKYYITPKSYLDCVNLYIQLLAEKRRELYTAQDRFLNGLNKLKETNVLIESMKVISNWKAYSLANWICVNISLFQRRYCSNFVCCTDRARETTAYTC